MSVSRSKTAYFEHWFVFEVDLRQKGLAKPGDRDVVVPGWVRVPPQDSHAARQTDAFGIPWLSMARGFQRAPGAALGGELLEDTRQVRLAGTVYNLPTRILPLGFTLNNLLAAGVLLGMVEGFALARRRVRRAKGRCVACGYDRGGLADNAVACPECGGAV